MNQIKIIVLGDIILDQYYSGSVSRISPEAPVPIIKLKEKYETLGGAANVANNIASLNAYVTLIGTLGNDSEGESVVKLLKEKNIDITSLNKSVMLKTITKIRLTGNNQQIVRVDYNDDERPSDEDIDQMIEKFESIINDYDIVVISDYNKGNCSNKICQTVISKCNSIGKVVIVDPKGNNWEKYSGATVITPNLKEISEYVGNPLENSDLHIEEKCKELPSQLNIENVLITRAEKGITLINIDGVKHFPSKAREVYDVTGAGDTVVAAISTFIRNSSNIAEAINLANTAAGIVVGKRGTATVTLDEIDKELNSNMKDQVSSKIHSIDELMKKVERLKREGKTIVFTNGCYDIFHKGHAFSIYSAAKFGDHLIVAVNADASIKRLKGVERPINNQDDRAYIIASLGCVDSVIIFEEDTPEKLLSLIRPDVLVKGGDYKIEEVLGREYAERVELIKYVDGYSTTELIKKMNIK